MGGKPEVRNQHCLKLHNGIASFKAHKSDREKHARHARDTGHGQRKTFTRHPFHQQTQQHRRGGNEKNGLIKRGDGWAAHDNATDDDAGN